MTATEKRCARCGRPMRRPFAAKSKYCMDCAIDRERERQREYNKRRRAR